MKLTIVILSSIMLSLSVYGKVEFVTIEATTFNMKGNTVTLTRPFAIMKTEMTQRQWHEMMGENPSKFSTAEYCSDHHRTIDGVEMCPNHPVERVSWNEVQIFIKKLNQKMGNTGCQDYHSMEPGCYRLPTEAEWELALLQTIPWNIHENAKQTHKVGTKGPHRGLRDMDGNVWEWVWDVYREKLPEGTNPLQTDSATLPIHNTWEWEWEELIEGITERVILGCSWRNDKSQCLRSGYRTNDLQGHGSSNVGFRLVKSL